MQYYRRNKEGFSPFCMALLPSSSSRPSYRLPLFRIVLSGQGVLLVAFCDEDGCYSRVSQRGCGLYLTGKLTTITRTFLPSPYSSTALQIALQHPVNPPTKRPLCISTALNCYELLTCLSAGKSLIHLHSSQETSLCSQELGSLDK